MIDTFTYSVQLNIMEMDFFHFQQKLNSWVRLLLQVFVHKYQVIARDLVVSMTSHIHCMEYFYGLAFSVLK